MRSLLFLVTLGWARLRAGLRAASLERFSCVARSVNQAHCLSAQEPVPDVCRSVGTGVVFRSVIVPDDNFYSAFLRAIHSTILAHCRRTEVYP